MRDADERSQRLTRHAFRQNARQLTDDEPRLDEGCHRVAHRHDAARGLGADQHIVEIALASIQLGDTRFDLSQTRGLLGQCTFRVGAPHFEHGAELIGGGILVDDPADLLQRETQVAKHQDAVQALQLRGV